MKWVVAFLFFTAPIFAMYNGNPFLPNMPEEGMFSTENQWWGIKVGFETDHIFNKQVETHKGAHRKFDTFYSRKREGVITFNIIDRIECFAGFGVMEGKLSSKTQNNLLMEYESDSHFLWSFGGRVILIYWDEMIMGVNGRFNFSHLEFDRLQRDGMAVKPMGSHLHYREWQVGVSFSREVGPLIPYVGLAFAAMQSSHFHDHTLNKKRKQLENEQPFILLLGVGLSKGKGVSLNLESRLIGEQALALTGEFRF